MRVIPTFLLLLMPPFLPPVSLADATSSYLAINHTSMSMLQGDIGDTFFILKEGRALVTQNSSSSNKSGGRENKLRHMEEYSCFGERALLTAEPRSANVIAETKVR